MTKTCKHSDQIVAGIKPTPPKGCAECLKMGSDFWFSLRMCLTCGHIGCCDSSPQKHAAKHFHDTGHPIMEGYRTKREFRWCYIDEVTL